MTSLVVDISGVGYNISKYGYMSQSTLRNKHMKKKIVASLLVISLVIGMVGCGKTVNIPEAETAEDAESNNEVAPDKDTETGDIDEINNSEDEEISEVKVVRKKQEGVTREINVNQVGFLTNARKTCVVRSEDTDGTFMLIDENDEVVYKGNLVGPFDAATAREKVYRGDFSDFTTPGEYTIVVSNGDESYPFTIGDNVYDALLVDTLLMLTRQRCGMQIGEELLGGAAHSACHDTEAVIYGTNIRKEVNGGWHDAGDYGRYVSPGAMTVMDLFLAYEDYPELWDRDDLGIPESGNGIPDILDEARYELDWMIKMQDASSGGVYHKVTCKSFPGFIHPQFEKDELVISPISNTATGDFAAIMAKASMVYADIDPDFCARALAASQKAYSYLEGHMDAKGFKNPEGVVTGEYGDGQFLDEMYWAAVELYKATDEQKYRDFVEETLGKHIYYGLGWADMGTYGNIEYMSLAPDKQNPELLAKLIKGIETHAKEFLNNSKGDGYMVDLGNGYVWGSNLSVSNFAREMLLAAKDSDKADEFETAAYDQVSYMLGQNSLSYCFVTGYGSLKPIHPHHRPSIAGYYPQPGMVVGGPDSGLQDDVAASKLVGKPAAKCYIDNNDSYSTNEVAIYWNSPFLYLLSAEISRNK